MHRNDFQTFMAPFEQQIQEQMEAREKNAMVKHGRAEDYATDYAMGRDDFVSSPMLDREENPYKSLRQGAGMTGLARSRAESMKAAIQQKNEQMKTIVLEDFEQCGVLGRGTFGKVIMVKHKLYEDQVRRVGARSD